MGFDQYHEPANELPQETRTFARMIASLTEEAEAIGWYEQRLAVEPNLQARAIMANAQGEEFKHFGMDLELFISGLLEQIRNHCRPASLMTGTDPCSHISMKVLVEWDVVTPV